MFKLLTPETKNKVEHEYSLRRTALFVSAAGLALFLCAIALLPSYIVSAAKRSEMVALTEARNLSSGSEDSKKLRDWLRETNIAIGVLSPQNESVSPYNYFTSLIAERPEGIRIIGLNMNKEAAAVKISVRGVARDRRTLLSFEDKLNASGKFSAINIPVSNFAKDRDINFEFSLEPLK